MQRQTEGGIHFRGPPCVMFRAVFYPLPTLRDMEQNIYLTIFKN
jgi:hypothetical protein